MRRLWDPADYLPQASPETRRDLPELTKAVIEHLRSHGVPFAFWGNLTYREALAWLAHREGAVVYYQMAPDLRVKVLMINSSLGRA